MSDTRKARRSNDERKRRQAYRVASLYRQICDGCDIVEAHTDALRALKELCALAAGDVT